MAMTADASRIIGKVVTVAGTAVITSLLTFGYSGINAISKVDAQSMIEKAEAKHEATLEIVLSKLGNIEVEQAKLEERIDALKEEMQHVRGR
jgi:hypothetical protein